MKIYNSILFVLILSFSSCAFVTNFAKSSTEKEMYDLNTFKVEKIAKNAAYGYTSQEPIKIGGANENEGILNERRFLNALRGPKGEKVTYELKGSCCYYKLPGKESSDIGLLDRYEVKIGEEIHTLYFTSFEEEGELKAPKGFSVLSN